MTRAERSAELARRLVDLYNKGTADWVDICHDPASQWHEMPTALFPQGRSGGRDALRQAAEHGIQLVPNRRMTIRNLVAGPTQVALELDWVGTPSVSVAASIDAGTAVQLRVAMFLTFAQGKVVTQIDYAILMPVAE